MRVSIIIPVYNSERFVAATIRSALDQTWPDKEIIVVDDGSTDGSLGLARGFEKQGVTVLQETNRGGSAARNAGFWASKGDFIQFLDHDDLLHPEKIARQLGAGQRRAGAPVAGKWIRFRGDTTGTLGSWEPGEKFLRDLSAVDWLIGAPVIPTCAWLYPRDLVIRSGLWNETLHANPADDFEFQIRAASHAGQIISCPEALSYFRTENPDHAGGNRSISSQTSVFQICNLYRSVLLSMSDSPEARKSCADRYYHFMYMAYPQCSELVAEAGRIIRSLGFPSCRVPGTPAYERLSRFLGWKLARRIQRWTVAFRKHI